MDMRRIIRKNFARLRKENRLTQHKAAESSGLTQAYIGWLAPEHEHNPG
jgi:transcriptional regulator with XRE-family HTH domain